MIVTVARHDGLREIGLAVENRAQIEQHGSKSTVFLGWLIDIASQPSRRVVPQDLKTILERDGKAIEWWERFAAGILLAVCIQLSGSINGFVEEYLSQTIRLAHDDRLAHFDATRMT